jgi:magnesium chelatase family protein
MSRSRGDPWHTPAYVGGVLSRVNTFALHGLDCRRVVVEVDLRSGLPAFTIVGLGDRAVREARERVWSALANSGFRFPANRVTVNLAPAHLRKTGPGFDLAIACGVLAASGQVPADVLAEYALHAELSLFGELRPSRGALALAEAAARSGLTGVIVAAEVVHEAALAGDLQVVGAHSLATVAGVLRGEEAPPAPPDRPPPAPSVDAGVDLADVLGHADALEAGTIAAAGGHNLLMSGPPGAGKTMLARRVPTVLRAMTRGEAVEVTRIYSVAGLHDGSGLVRSRPFRAPHHSISASGLVGGGAPLRPGEATLAHNGVLFLDELSEFARPALEALRQPLEDGRVAIVRGQRSAVFPTRTMLVAATNPCPCGYAGSDRCRCGESDHARHRRRLSGPLLDRIDLLVHVHRPTGAELGEPPVTSSAAVRDAVAQARERQTARLEASGCTCNGQMGPAALRRHVRVEPTGERQLRLAYDRGHLSARGHQRILRVARTIADLDGADRVRAEHVLRALALRVDLFYDERGAAA